MPKAPCPHRLPPPPPPPAPPLRAAAPPRPVPPPPPLRHPRPSPRRPWGEPVFEIEESQGLEEPRRRAARGDRRRRRFPRPPSPPPSLWLRPRARWSSTRTSPRLPRPRCPSTRKRRRSARRARPHLGRDPRRRDLPRPRPLRPRDGRRRADPRVAGRLAEEHPRQGGGPAAPWHRADPGRRAPRRARSSRSSSGSFWLTGVKVTLGGNPAIVGFLSPAPSSARCAPASRPRRSGERRSRNGASLRSPCPGAVEHLKGARPVVLHHEATPGSRLAAVVEVLVESAPQLGVALTHGPSGASRLAQEHARLEVGVGPEGEGEIGQGDHRQP